MAAEPDRQNAQDDETEEDEQAVALLREDAGVKDRVLGHNPLAALYPADGYFHDRLFPAAQDQDVRPRKD